MAGTDRMAIRKFFNDASIKHKLVMIGLMTTGIALLFSTLFLITDEVISFRRSLVKSIEVQAEIVGSNSTAALLFQNRKDAEEILSALRFAPNITDAYIYRNEGEVFAGYQRDDKKGYLRPPPYRGEGHYYKLDRLSLFRHIVIDNRTIGTICIQSDLHELYYHILWYGGTVAIVVVLAFSIVFLLLSKFHHSITRPLLDLVGLMHIVSSDKNYTVRASINNLDETGSLATGFNEMLTQIQARDMELEHHRKQLEDLVIQRTADLENINEQLQQELSERKRIEEKIAYMAYHDTITNLPNRYLLIDRLHQALSSAKKHNRLLAILFLDLDNFKHINDTLGHNAGDVLLESVAERFVKYLRKTDTIASPGMEDVQNTVARLGGDEFTILLTDISSIQDAAKVSRRIIDLFAQPFMIGVQEVFVTTSIGISLYPNDGENVETLLKNADTAMYHAKDQGKNQFQFFTAAMNSAALERFALENNLRKALEQSELELYYQPQIDTDSWKIFGVEALVRWKHPAKGLLLPSEFISLAEETGLILPIGEWILHAACKQKKEWQDAGVAALNIIVNMSGVQFKHKKFMEIVAKALTDTRLDPQYLELELTESILMSSAEKTITTLKALKAMGLKLSIDDFGTGYSSLSYLKRFPIDTLKIDCSFVKDITTDPDNKTIVKAIIAMAHSLNLKVIAEGVESMQQMIFLHKQDIHGMQGNLFSPAIPADSLMEFMKDGKKLADLKKQFDEAINHPGADLWDA